MEKRVIETRTHIMRDGGSPNNLTGLEAWEVALENVYPDLTEKQQSEFVREWYGAITRSKKVEMERRKSEGSSTRSNGRRVRGYDKNGEPTNSFRAERMERQVEIMWDALLTFVNKKKGKRIQKKVADTHAATMEKIQEIQRKGAEEKARIDARRAERKAEKEG